MNSLALAGVAAVLCPALMFGAAAEVTYNDFTQAIRANDLAALNRLVRDRKNVTVENKLRATPLHYAASFGSAEAVSLLLAAGADPNARNSSGGTPLLYGAWNFERTRSMVDKGGDVQAANKQGVTPLMVACSIYGNTAAVQYLTDKGANVHALDEFHSDALINCAEHGDTESISLLIARGADAHTVSKAGFTALLAAASDPSPERLQILLAAGADPNASNTFGGRVKNGPINLIHLTPLMLVAPYATPEMVQLLLKSGARVNDSDNRKMTPLMLSLATDQANPAVVKVLIDAGADVNAQDQTGESVLDWALKYRQPEIVAMLEAAGAKSKAAAAAQPDTAHSGSPTSSEAFARAAPLLAKAGPEFFREGGGCAGCHHQTAYARVQGAWTGAGVEPKIKLQQPFLDGMTAMRPMIAGASLVLGDLPGDIDPCLYMLAAYADLHAAANDTTDMLVRYIVSRQARSGAWMNLGTARAPIEDSTITRTVYAIRALRQYGWPARQAEFDSRISLARGWLLSAHPVTTYEAAERLLGLQIAGVSRADLRSDAGKLIAAQRADGGWAQTQFLDSDAYATGMVLDILYKTGLAGASDPVYRRGIAYLLKNQYSDGAWYVRSRAPKFQPYFQSSFPFDHDQWISSAGTSWALIALSHEPKGAQ